MSRVRTRTPLGGLLMRPNLRTVLLAESTGCFWVRALGAFEAKSPHCALGEVDQSVPPTFRYSYLEVVLARPSVQDIDLVNFADLINFATALLGAQDDVQSEEEVPFGWGAQFAPLALCFSALLFSFGRVSSLRGHLFRTATFARE